MQMSFQLMKSFILLGLMVSHPLIASEDRAQHIPLYDTHVADKTITDYYQHQAASHSIDMDQRVLAASKLFLGKPYLLGALGEGPGAEIDQSPLYRVDAFDCVTYVSTVVALAHSDTLSQFQDLIKKVNYRDGLAIYEHRNHFMSVDWNYNNTYNGFVRDVTYKIVNKDGTPAAAIADTIIDKANWYAFKKRDVIKSTKVLDKNIEINLLKKLKFSTAKLKREKSVLLYIPLSQLFDANGKANKSLFKQIPTASIVEIVRPNWALKDIIGTNMQVSHLGVALQSDKGLLYREASQLEGKVIDIPLVDYLKPYIHSKTIKGINIQKIV